MRRVPLLLAGLGLLGAVAALLFAPARTPRPAAPPGAPIVSRLALADPANGAHLFRRCAACHTIGADGTDTDGPNLHGVLNGPVARRRPRFAYTAALAGVGGSWTPDRMDRWLTSPRAFAPGTSMAFPGLPDPQDRADVIAYLGR